MVRPSNTERTGNTDPSLRLDQVPVTAADCQTCKTETGTKLDQITKTLTRIEGKHDTHLAWHKGKEHAQAGWLKKGQFWLVLIGMLLTLVGSVWALSRSLPNATEIAKALKQSEVKP